MGIKIQRWIFRHLCPGIRFEEYNAGWKDGRLDFFEYGITRSNWEREAAKKWANLL